MPDRAGKSYFVLMVDDSDDDGALTEFAFQKLKQFRLVGRATDGNQAIAYLKGEGHYANRLLHPFPDVLLLDLRMPRVDGFEVLSWLKTQSFSDLKIIVLSGSDYVDDIGRALELGAHYYLTKPLQFDHQVDMLRSLEESVAQTYPPNRG